MKWTARDLMKSSPKVVGPEMKLPDLERAFLAEKVSGFPVVSGGRLVGIVTRSDVVRQLCVEQSVAETISDYFRDLAHLEARPEAVDDIAVRVGRRIENLRVRDVMVREVITVRPGASEEEVARTLLEHKIHRVAVTEGDHLLGVISSLDLVRRIAHGKAVSA